MDKGGTSYVSQVHDDFPKDVTVLEGWSATVDEKMQRTDTKDGVRNSLSSGKGVFANDLTLLGSDLQPSRRFHRL
jgi:hypothetical protein